MSEVEQLQLYQPAHYINFSAEQGAIKAGESASLILPLTVLKYLSGSSGWAQSLQQLGFSLGGEFFTRLSAEVPAALKVSSLAEVPVPDFLALFNQFLASHGLGRCELSQDDQSIIVDHSGGPNGQMENAPVAHFFAGLLAAFFAPLAGGDLKAELDPAAAGDPHRLRYRLRLAAA